MVIVDITEPSRRSIQYLTILIFEKLINPSSVVFEVPSSMNDRSVKYIPKYGMHGGSDLQAIVNNTVVLQIQQQTNYWKQLVLKCRY